MQVQVLDWLYRNFRQVYLYTHATPNGGLRAKVTAKKLVEEGLKKGYPDLSIDLPAGRYHGMRIELKYGHNHLTAEQVEWMSRLTAVGYYCFEARSFEEAKAAIQAYIELDGDTQNDAL